ncbi:DUF262 domain-containing protein [Enterovibrio norvegicus]|uniref:DUF262 domain-containing protein n=1 Tax=Enterovibrio norvegicus TaxID=188144 RepID=UPI0024B19CBD|nr:DUF262 domain-containing HNH endonuclease family protein [Enterovibrio norvegicus]
MASKDDLKPLKIRELFDPSTQYVIPIYQRNYAWGASEIEQLIQDIDDASVEVSSADSSSSDDEVSKYFLGSLVVYVRNNEASQQQNVYETIDGQQRHTTLSILLAYLKNIGQLKYQGFENISLNLTFDSRPKSERALSDLYNNEASGESEEPSIHSAYQIIKRCFEIKQANGKPRDVARFCGYLLHNVTILRVAVPQDTDLNHYFEIMNNRGEQLEKHEVLKAKMMSEFGEDAKTRDCFSAVWDACADMKRYVQLGFEAQKRTAIFGDKWRSFPENFEVIQSQFFSSESLESGLSLQSIIFNRALKASSTSVEVEKEERFDSIIDFSNFLLHVLKIMLPEDGVSLDDKKLLDAFYDSHQQLKVNPTEFVFNLLKYRVLFDRYIIKRDFDEKWSLLTVEKYTESFSFVNSFGKDEELETNQKLVMLLSMFHVSNPALVYKRWLNSALEALGELAQSSDLQVNGEDYVKKLESLSDNYFDEICVIEGHFQESVLHEGTAVQNFIFNRLDYLLWKHLLRGESFDGIGKDKLGKHFGEFQFSFRTSVEHYFPQTDPSGATAKERGMDNVDRFGNLCLISPSSNSRLSNYSPTDKKSFYRENSRAESLKQAMMMSYEDWGPDGQGFTNIQNHEQAMLKLLKSRSINENHLGLLD